MNNVLPGEQKRGETFLDRKYFYYPITKLDPRSDPTLVVDTRTVSVLFKVIKKFYDRRAIWYDLISDSNIRGITKKRYRLQLQLSGDIFGNQSQAK